MIMANPEHTPEMEPLDRLTVALYRSGLSLFALVTLLEAAELLTGTAVLLTGTAVLGAWHLPLTATAAQRGCRQEAGAGYSAAGLHALSYA